jgi:hypothetical protein
MIQLDADAEELFHLKEQLFVALAAGMQVVRVASRLLR